MGYLRQFMNAWREEASTTRIFFPDNGELAIALSGQTSDPAAGRAALDPIFTETRWNFGYLTKQSSLQLQGLIGINLDKWNAAELVKDTDRLIVVAYPSFNPKVLASRLMKTIFAMMILTLLYLIFVFGQFSLSII